MKRLILILLLTVLATVAFGQSTISLASEEWEDGTNADGSGFYWDLIRLVYEPVGIGLEHTIVPYERSVRMTEAGEVDGWVASYIDEEDFALYPRHAFDMDNITAVHRSDTRFEGLESLEGATAAWIRGYAYDELLEIDMSVREVNDRISGLRMLKAGRVDFFLDAFVEIEWAIEDAGFDTQNLRFCTVQNEKLYLAFADTQRGRNLREIWDERMAELHRSGELRALYDEHDYASYYPF